MNRNQYLCNARKCLRSIELCNYFTLKHHHTSSYWYGIIKLMNGQKKKGNADQRPMKKLLFQVSTTPTSYAGAGGNAFRTTFFHYLVFEPEPRNIIRRYTGLLGMWLNCTERRHLLLTRFGGVVTKF